MCSWCIYLCPILFLLILTFFSLFSFLFSLFSLLFHVYRWWRSWWYCIWRKHDNKQNEQYDLPFKRMYQQTTSSCENTITLCISLFGKWIVCDEYSYEFEYVFYKLEKKNTKYFQRWYTTPHMFWGVAEKGISAIGTTIPSMIPWYT